MSQLVECIPNFSTAQPETVDELVAVLKAVPEIQLLDRTSDVDHNRSVLTFAGSPQAVEEAAFRVIRKACELIDLSQHRGVHPRIGAADVVPFVPLAGVTMEECVAMAHRLGQRVGTELEIPVYFYENAAARPERARLENVRRGQYEGLKEEIDSNPERLPDCGPNRIGPAGAVAIGARAPLVAFNIYLATDKVEIAQKIAKTVRQSSGGLPHVKALGLLVGGLAQVSLNLTNFRETSLHLVVETIRAEAQQAGVEIHHSELIGLIPQDALTEAAASYLQLDGFKPDYVLENRLQPVVGVQVVSAPTGPVEVAAVSAAQAAGLLAGMVGQTLGKPRYADVEEEMKNIREQVENLARELAKSIRDDAQALEKITAAFKLPAADKAQEKARNESIEQAAIEALQVPLGVARKIVEIMSLAERCALVGNLSAIADAAAASSLAQGALLAVGYNIRINVDALQKKAHGEAIVFEMDALEARATQLHLQTRQALRKRAGLTLE